MDPLTIVFALVAVLVIWKLNSVLGQSGGVGEPRVKARPPARRDAPAAATQRGDNVVRLPGTIAPPPAADLARWTDSLDPAAEPGTAAGLQAIAAADPQFSAAPFLDGAKTAYEAVVSAYAAGERKTLQALLARDVYAGFEAAIREREGRRESLATTFVAVGDARIATAAMDGRAARVGVRFLSKQISVTRAADGTPVSGSPDQVLDMNDIWTFRRDTASRDPNWQLVATQAGT